MSADRDELATKILHLEMHYTELSLEKIAEAQALLQDDDTEGAQRVKSIVTIYQNVALYLRQLPK